MSHSGCRCCGHSSLLSLVDFQQQPVSNRFVPAPLEAGDHFPLALMQCPQCGLIQLQQDFPVAALQPLRPLRYVEPERHLDHAVDILQQLDPLAAKGQVAGLTYKDDSTLARFEKSGATIWRPTPADMGEHHPYANIESAQAAFTPQIAQQLLAQHGPVDVLVARHILEHCDQPHRLLKAAASLLRPDGLLMIEIPDCTKSLDTTDYTMVWEEHAAYFTPATAATMLQQAGFNVLSLTVHAYPYEDLIVAIARQSQSRPLVTPVESDLVRGSTYGQSFGPRTQALRQKLEAERQAGRTLSLFGAGHLTAAFVNYHRLADLFTMVIDDNEWKTGNLLAGTTLPIVPSTTLLDHPGGLCLLGLNPDVEEKVIDKNQAFTATGGTFQSILADSPRFLLR
jgi:hypothetical protein